MAKKLSIAEKIKRSKDKRNANALVGSRFEFENNLEIIEEEIELNNIKYDIDVDAREIIDNIIEQREEFLEENKERDIEIFERELTDWCSNTQVSDTKKNRIKVNIDSISGALRFAKNSDLFAGIFMKEYEEEVGVFSFNYKKYRKKIYSKGLTFYKDRIDLETGAIDDKLVYLSWNGEECSEVSRILWENGTDWAKFIKDIVKFGAFKPTRIDGAVTFVGDELIKLSTIKRKLERGLYKGHFKNKPTIVSGVGDTYYLGYKQDCMIRFYDKKIETILKRKLRTLEYLKDNYPEVTRIEIQMRNKYAKAFIDDVIKYNDIENCVEETIRSWLCKKITFLSEPKGKDTNKSRLSVAPFWREFSEVKLDVKATYVRRNTSLEDNITHVVRSNKSLAAAFVLKKYYHTNQYYPKNEIMEDLIKSSFTFLGRTMFSKSNEYLFNEEYYVSRTMYYKLIDFALSEEDEDLLAYIKEHLIIKE